MNGAPPNPPENDPSENDLPETDALVREARLKRERRERWLQEGDISVGRRLAQIGVLGWIFVTPMLAGLFLGRWLDARLDAGIFWTAPLLLTGLAFGGWAAWKWMNAP